MKNLYLVDVCGTPEGMSTKKLSKSESAFDETDIGEVQGIFDDKGSLLGWWDCNDLNLYVSPLEGIFSKLGYKFRGPENKKKDRQFQNDLYGVVREVMYGED